MGELILAATSSKASSGSSSYLLLFIIVLFVLFYFVAIRPQRNRQRRVQQTQNELAPGQRVRTTAGMYATISAIDGDDILLEVAPGVEVRYLRRAVMEVLPDDDGTFGETDDDTPGEEDEDYDEATDEVGEESDTSDEEDSPEHAEEPDGDEMTPTASAAATVTEDGAAGGAETPPNGSPRQSARKGRTAG
jgi:preprotein translocase subunit YajC